MKMERDRYISYYKDANFLRFKQFSLERDILRIAAGLFEAEKSIKTGSNISKVSIPISYETYIKIDAKRLQRVLEELVLLILYENLKVEIAAVDDLTGRVHKTVTFPQKETIILFSGGVDSYAGLKMAEQKYESLLGIFVAHNDQSRIINIVHELKRTIITEIKTLYAPGMGSLGYSQLRGFLYVLYGGAILNVCAGKNLLVTECGPTMYQPLFSPYDSITYTTHPYVLKAALEVLKIILPFKPRIIIPFEDLTKAEIISNSGIKDFSETHSCLSQRFGDHDGTCFGCVTKRLSCLINGVKDVAYNKDVFQPSANQDNLLNLLVFSEELVDHYDRLPYFQRDKIDEFKKLNLFTRFALDSLAGLMMAVDKKHFLYKRFVKRKKILEHRVSEIIKNPQKPDFTKAIV